MLAITVRFLHGTVRAGSPDDTVMAGGSPTGEWPPSPARLFSALVAAGGTRDRSRTGNGDELAALEALDAPRVLADAADDVAQTTLVPRFVPRDATAAGVVQNYPARVSTEVRPGVKASPRTQRVTYVWDADPNPDHVAALRVRALRVGYLGCADSPVQVTVSTDVSQEGLVEWRPGGAGGTTLPVAYPGFTAALDRAFDAWSAGEATRRSWVPSRREWYAPAASAPPGGDDRPTVVWLDFARRVPGRRALLVTETLRDALLVHCDDVVAGDEDPPPGQRAPWVLHGHRVPDEVARPYQIARYLSLANVGHPHSDGAIHGAAIWLPPGTPAGVIELVRAVAFTRLRELRGPGLRVAVAPSTAARGKWSSRPERWSRPARRWFSATPVVVERGRRRGQVSRMCAPGSSMPDIPRPMPCACRRCRPGRGSLGFARGRCIARAGTAIRSVGSRCSSASPSRGRCAWVAVEASGWASWHR